MIRWFIKNNDKKISSINQSVINIISLLVFGHFFGIVGMVLATPCLSILKVLFEFTKEKLIAKKII